MVVLSGRLLGASEWAAAGAGGAVALEMELIAKPARSSAGVPAAAVYRR